VPYAGALDIDDNPPGGAFLVGFALGMLGAEGERFGKEELAGGRGGGDTEIGVAPASVYTMGFGASFRGGIAGPFAACGALPLPLATTIARGGGFLAWGGFGGGALCTVCSPPGSLCCSNILRLEAMEDLSPAGAISICYAKIKIGN
jgi:hypothetical protein